MNTDKELEQDYEDIKTKIFAAAEIGQNRYEDHKDAIRSAVLTYVDDIWELITRKQDEVRRDELNDFRNHAVQNAYGIGRGPMKVEMDVIDEYIDARLSELGEQES